MTRLGPGTLLFMAMQAQERQDQDSARKLLSAAVAHETGLYARLAAERYLLLLKDQADGPGLLALTSSEDGRYLSPLTRANTEAEALSMTGRHAQALRTWTRFRTEHPEEAADNEITVRSGVLQAAIGIGTPEARQIVAEEFQGLLEMTGTTPWYTAMADVLEALQAHPAVAAAVHEQDLVLAQARVLFGTRDYGASVRVFKRYLALTFPLLDPDSPATAATLVSTLDRAALSDLARAYLFGSRSEGQAIFNLLASRASVGSTASVDSTASVGSTASFDSTASTTTQDASAGVDPQTAYLHMFWAGRFARAAECWREAAALFSAAAELARNATDLDAALWYEVETRSKYSATEAVAVLAKAYVSTTNPAYYSDLLEPLSRKALADRSGSTLAAIIAAATPGRGSFYGNTASGATPRDRARLDYLGARAAATGLISAGHLRNAAPEILGASIDAFISAALNRAYRQDVDPWYRLLAAFRLGLPLVEPADGPGAPEPPPGPIITTEDQALIDHIETVQTTPSQVMEAEIEELEPKLSTETPGEADTLVRGLIRFGLAAQVRTELGPIYRELEPSTIRAVAEALVEVGDYGTAIRSIAPLFSRPGYVPSRRDRELYWPQAFLAETKAVSERFNLPEALLFGLVRSESLFQPAVVSRAGAVGLAQLMPATAAETAGRLRIPEYDITNPADNLTLGASYFRRILDNRNGRFMPAIFSYNAGPTRFLRWENQYGPLPQDLLLEVLDYAETRQYGRNVVAAAMAYAALYYEDDLHGFLRVLLGEQAM